MVKVLAWIAWLAFVLPVEPAGRGWPETAEAPEAGFLCVQRKPYDRGNCFHWPDCRGESLGAMWVHAPEFCAAMGGRSWLDEETGRCHDLPPYRPL